MICSASKLVKLSSITNEHVWLVLDFLPKILMIRNSNWKRGWGCKIEALFDISISLMKEHRCQALNLAFFRVNWFWTQSSQYNDGQAGITKLFQGRNLNKNETKVYYRTSWYGMYNAFWQNTFEEEFSKTTAYGHMKNFFRMYSVKIHCKSRFSLKYILSLEW